jgi:hypothetical protein
MGSMTATRRPANTNEGNSMRLVVEVGLGQVEIIFD